MSAFDGKPTEPSVEATIESYVSELVKTKGEEWSNPEVIAKGKYEADKFVTDLQRQIAELREDISESSKIDELMSLVREGQKAEVPPVEVPGDTSTDLDPEKLKALIEDHVSQREQTTTREKNLEVADKMLTDKYGDGATRVLQTRASELGMSVDELKEAAARNPKAFAKLVGTDSTDATSVFVGNTQRSEGGSIKQGDTRNFAYYQDLRRKSKAKYHTTDVQQQMHKDAAEQGASFYGN